MGKGLNSNREALDLLVAGKLFLHIQSTTIVQILYFWVGAIVIVVRIGNGTGLGLQGSSTSGADVGERVGELKVYGGAILRRIALLVGSLGKDTIFVDEEFSWFGAAARLKQRRG